MCKAGGCNEDHLKHYCKNCCSADSNHLSRNCNKIKKIQNCRAEGFNESHLKHYCKNCLDDNSNHLARFCEEYNEESDGEAANQD